MLCGEGRIYSSNSRGSAGSGESPAGLTVRLVAVLHPSVSPLLTSTPLPPFPGATASGVFKRLSPRPLVRMRLPLLLVLQRSKQKHFSDVGGPLSPWAAVSFARAPTRAREPGIRVVRSVQTGARRATILPECLRTYIYIYVCLY